MDILSVFREVRFLNMKEIKNRTGLHLFSHAKKQQSHTVYFVSTVLTYILSTYFQVLFVNLRIPELYC